MIDIGSDNVSVIVSINNEVHKKLLREVSTLIHVSCVYHSLQLDVSAAGHNTLPRNIEFFIREIYNRIAHITLRQIQYENIYKAINDNHIPLKFVKSCDTH